MYNGKAYVSTNSVRVPVYAFDDDNITLESVIYIIYNGLIYDMTKDA